MIHYLQGKLISQTHEAVPVLVIAPEGMAGVGYGVHVPGRAEYLAFSVGSPVTLWVYTHVREDQLDLFGFASPQEKNLFLQLMTVNGVGAKSALGLLGAATPDRLVQSILEGDKDTLCALPGVGEKTAARLILELKKKLAKQDLPRAKNPVAVAGAGVSAILQKMRDSRDALLSLGYRETDVARLLDQWSESGVLRELSPEQVIKRALKEL